MFTEYGAERLQRCESFKRFSILPCSNMFYRVISRAEEVQTVFKDSDMHSKGINNDAGWLMGELLGRCLGLVNGSEWRQIRHCMSEAFTKRSAASHITRITEITQEFFSDLGRNGRLDTHTLNPSRDLRLLAFWIVADYLYGPLSSPVRAELEALIPLRESLFSRVIQGGVTRFSWSKHLPLSTNRDLSMFKARWEKLNHGAYRECRDGKRIPPMVRMYESFMAGSITLDNFLQTMDEMLFGNLDVTIGALAWNPLFLATNPEVQNQLRQEIRGAREAWDKYLVSSDTLLAASILESARLKPIAAFTIPQAAPTDRKVGGYVVPAGNNFVVSTRALNIEDPYWGPDRAEYRPARFLGRKLSGMRYRYWRFGFGPRQCLGKYLADLIIRIVVAHMVENYQLGLTSSSTWEKNGSTWISQPDCDIRCERISPKPN